MEPKLLETEVMPATDDGQKNWLVEENMHMNI